jgi:cytochrome c
MLKYLNLLLVTVFLCVPAVADKKFGLGREALPEEIAAWDIDILPDGRGLPKGSGDAIVGEEVFALRCASCHGDFAEGVDNWPVLAGGFDTLADKDPVKTVGSYWPHLSTVWDYINRSMPFGAAQTLTADEVYAITAYILYSNDMIEDDFVLSHENFNDVQMHNKDGFIIDDRAANEYKLWQIKPCMNNCKKDVKITMRASVIDVTPEDETSKKDDLPTAVASNSAKQQTSNATKPTTVKASIADTKISFNEELAKSGKKVFNFCMACHQTGPKAKNGLGPHLYKLFGRTIGGVDKFSYSKSFQDAAKAGKTWDEQNLKDFLKDPGKYMPKTKMIFPGLKSEDDLTALIEYLKSINE